MYVCGVGRLAPKHAHTYIFRHIYVCIDTPHAFTLTRAPPSPQPNPTPIYTYTHNPIPNTRNAPPHAPEAEVGDVLDLILAIAGKGLGKRREGTRAAAVEEEVGLVAVGAEARDGVQLRGGLVEVLGDGGMGRGSVIGSGTHVYIHTHIHPMPFPFPTNLRLHPVGRVGRPVALQVVLRVEDDALPLGGAGGEGRLRVHVCVDR